MLVRFAKQLFPFAKKQKTPWKDQKTGKKFLLALKCELKTNPLIFSPPLWGLRKSHFLAPNIFEGQWMILWFFSERKKDLEASQPDK